MIQRVSRAGRILVATTAASVAVLTRTTRALPTDGCSDGYCPPPVGYDAYGHPTEEEFCGLWLGPSPIKKAEEHGFGLGMFTGRTIPKGTTIESLYSDEGEVMIPIYGSPSINEEWPPLREYVWGEGNMPEVAIEYPHELTALFMPGLASIAPCTSENYNLQLLGTGTFENGRRDSVQTNSLGVHRSNSSTAGSFSYRHNVQYVAVRDIVPGEELTVMCDDDNFDGGAYFLSRFNSHDDASICLDDNIQVRQRPQQQQQSSPSSRTYPNIGKGLYAKRQLQQGSTIISTPVVPVLRKEMDILVDDVNTKQLMLNYCYGHSNSDLLLLPYGPLINHINHCGKNNKPNAQLQWHPMTTEETQSLHRREQHHHPELLKLSGEMVGTTHGKGLLLDLIALRTISPNEEIVIDYGSDWERAWELHNKQWTTRQHDSNYISAEDFRRQQISETRTNAMIPIRTEEEQQANPYPENLETFCFYEEPSIIQSKVPSQAYSWKKDTDHECFRPCKVLERFDNNSNDIERQVQDQDSHHYTILMSVYDNPRVIESCLISWDTVVMHVPQSAIRIVDRPYTTDVFLKSAFRHEIGVPDELYPLTWMRKKLRQKKQSKAAVAEDDEGEEFKRKKSNSLPTKATSSSITNITASITTVTTMETIGEASTAIV